MRRSAANRPGRAPPALGAHFPLWRRSLRTTESNSSASLQTDSAGVRPRSWRRFSRAAIILFTRFALKPKGRSNGENWFSRPKRSLQHLLRHLRSEVLGKIENLSNRKKLLHPSAFQAGQADAGQSFKESSAIVLLGRRHGSAASESD